MEMPTEEQIKKIWQTEQVMALTAAVQQQEHNRESADWINRSANERFTTDRWLDENEREWYAMDRLMRSRPWAKKKDEAFKYPFRDATNAMRAADPGVFVGDDRPTPPDTRGPAACDILTQVQIPPEFPPKFRALLFTPEFGTATSSFDMDTWSYLGGDELQDGMDIWAVCWQGWSDFENMMAGVMRAVLSLADGCSVVWFGQGMGAIIAYELLKRIDATKTRTPGLPVALVVSDCPAPHLFKETYKPYEKDGWKENLASKKITEMQRTNMGYQVGQMLFYDFKYADNKRINIPIAACSHEDDALCPADSVQAWEEYSREGDFEHVEIGDAEEFEDVDYMNGQGYSKDVDPTVLGTILEYMQKYDRYENEDKPVDDIGQTEGDWPEYVDCIVVGGGISGIQQGEDLVKAGKSVLLIEKAPDIGGVWNLWGNEFSRVNSSEVAYRFVERNYDPNRYVRPAEDHSSRKEVLRDFKTIAKNSLYGKVRLNSEVVKCTKREDGTYDVVAKGVKDGKENTVHCKIVTFHVNRRIGAKRWVDWPNSENFGGQIYYGYGNEVKDAKFWDKKVLVVGAGAFAFENTRTALEHGARHVTLLGRRDGTTSPKWIDIIAHLRPLDEYLMTHKSGNMISFECWQNAYIDAGIKTPDCWKDGLLKPNNHTVSVSDVSFVAAYHGMFQTKVGEIKCVQPDGLGVELTDGSTIDCSIIIKCTGFHLNRDVQAITGMSKMQPFGLMDFNLNYGAEPKLDGGQFGSAKDITHVDTELGYSQEDLQKGYFLAASLKLPMFTSQGNPFGSGQGGPGRARSRYFVWLVEHPEEQKALLKQAGAAPQDVTDLWLSQIAQYMGIMCNRIIAGLSSAI